MSVFHENMLIGASGQVAAGGISRSLRFNSADSAYLSRTPASAGNRKTWTWAGWVKRSGTGAVLDHIFLGSLVTDAEGIRFNSSDKIQFYLNGGSFAANLITTQVFRDFSAWYHIVVAVDTTQATASNRVKLYINGSQITAFDTSTYPSQNYDCPAINTTAVHWIGANIAGPFYSNFYLADCYLIDGSALTPSSFTETDATTGQLVKKAYTGSFTGNSFYLTFEDNSAATAAALGKDSSGLGNNWTPNNLSVTAGAGNDSLVDTPTSYGTDTGAGGEVRGNYATWNPLSKASVTTLSNGNLDASMTGSSYPHLGADSTIQIPVSGKWYWEITPTTVGELWLGVRNVVDGKQSTYYRDSTGGFNNIRIEASSSTGSSSVASYTNNDIIGVALNADSLTIAWYKNGSQVGSNFSLTTVQNLVPFVGHASSSGSAVCVVNFGQRPFAYTAPSGFKALCTANLPAPLVTKPSTVMDVALYTGNGSTQTISGLGFSPDLVWIKSRSNVSGQVWTDIVRGVGKELQSNSTAAETTDTVNFLTAFNSNGFSVGSDAAYNGSSRTYVAWTWDAGSSTVTNTAGSITSQVRANASAGFSIVTYTVSTSSQTAGHGLGVTPSFVLCKRRNGTSDWYFQSVIPGASGYLFLNSTAALTSASYSFNSTTFQVAYLGGSGEEWVAYCFAPVAGYSSFGSYTGNGSADGPFVYTGFRVKWYLVKQSSASGENWRIIDATRSPYNVAQDRLLPNSSVAEGAQPNEVDFLSNGFKFRSADGAYNGSGATYIYAAFAENPFQYARAR